MLWVCRSGKNAKNIDLFYKNNKIYLPWENYCIDLSHIDNLDEMKIIVKDQKNTDNTKSISNWASQLYTFANLIKIDDYVLIPEEKSNHFTLAKVISPYKYIDNKDILFHHSYDVEFIYKHIPSSIFPQNIRYSLGAFRSLFKANLEKEIFSIIEKYYEN